VADDEYEEKRDTPCAVNGGGRPWLSNVEDENKRHSCCGLMKEILKSNNKDGAENTTNTQVHWK
jgi:hypothetical protein